MILASDTFNSIGSTLPAGWEEQGSAPFATNMSTDGAQALIDSAPAWHAGIRNNTSQEDQFVQCWVRSPSSDAGNAGLIFRFIDVSNFYFIIGQPGNPWRLFRRKGGVTSGVLATTSQTVGTDIWQRMAVRCFTVGGTQARIQLYVDQNYDTSKEGPSIDLTESAANSVIGSGRCGITSSGNTLTGAAGPKWNDFICFDGGPQTIYVDTVFNGGVAGEGMGTADRPDLHIDWALNNAGLNRGGKLKFLQDGPITNPTTGQFKIGHAGKFGTAGWSFPAYDPDNGQVTSGGSPNLIIEGRDGGRTILREVQSPGAYFFRLRDTATGIVCRSVDFELLDSSSVAFRTEELGATNEHSVQFAKCKVTFEDPSGTSNAILLESTTAALRFECFFCFFDCDSATLNHGEYIRVDRRVQQLAIKYNVFKGLAGTIPGTGAEVSYAVVFDTSSDLQAGDAADIDHNSFIDLFRLFFNEGAVGILDAVGMAGAIEYQNNIVAGPGSAAPDSTTDFGIYTGGSAPTGSITAHHNGYFQVTTPRDTGVTNGGNELENTDPDFHPTAEGPFTWQHTAGGGVNGEGSSSAIVLPRDYRPRAAAYIDTADDATPNQILDRGALQSYIVVQPGPPSPSPSLPEPAPGFCPSVIFDPGGTQEFDLSGRLMQMTPLRYERDILLRSYRASDVTMEFMDTEGLFIESNEESFLRDPADGRPNWLGKRVVVTAVFGSQQLAQYEGYVLEVQAGRGTGILRIGNRFQQLFDRSTLANDIVRIVDTNGNPQHPRFSAAAGGYVARNHLTINLDAGAPVETLTFEIQSATTFVCIGSVSGFEGEGTIGQGFTTLSGSLTISPLSTWNVPFHTYAENQRFQIVIGWASSVLQNPSSLDTIRPILDIYREFLLSAQGGQLQASDLDPSVGAFETQRNNQMARPYVVDTPKTALDVIDELSLHMGAVTIEKSNAKIGLRKFTPELVAPGSIPLLCHGDDLNMAETEHLPIYNQFTFAFDYDVSTQAFQDGFIFPSRREDNASLTRYGRLYPAPRTFELRAFSDDIPDNEEWANLLAEILYRRYENPALVVRVKVKLARMDAELDDTYELDSEVPTMNVEAMEPFSIDKMLTDDLLVGMELVDVSALVQEEGACGFLSYDTAGQGYDQCWGYF